MGKAAESWTLALLPQFLDLTASRQIEIDIERENLEQGDDPVSAAREIGKIAHMIAGTAESFGFSDLGERARRVEALCGQIDADPGAAEAEAVRRSLLPALDDLTNAFDIVLVSDR